MPTIKNGAELVERAAWHREQDHISQGTYGDAEMNGHIEYKGCLIGCAAMPRGYDEMRVFIHTNYYRPMHNDNLKWYECGLPSENLMNRVTREFGICSGLLRSAECLFEAIDYHGAAIEFVYNFNVACALAEGYEITNADVRRFWDQHPKVYRDKYPYESRNGMDCRPELGFGRTRSVQDLANDFLAWIAATPERQQTRKANKTKEVV